MGLEEEIQKLKETETGEVEKTIRTVEDYNSKNKENLRENNEMFEEYEALIKQKLPVAIDNVFLLNSYIEEKDYLSPSWARKWDKCDIKPRKSRKNSELLLKERNFTIRLLSKKDEESTKEISLYQDYFSGFFNIISFGKKWRRFHCDIKSKSSSEFAEQLIPYLIEEIKKEGGELQRMVYEIIGIPNKIRKQYTEKSKEEDRKQEEIKKRLKELREIEIPYF
jgi:hypothetical protein